MLPLLIRDDIIYWLYFSKMYSSFNIYFQTSREHWHNSIDDVISGFPAAKNK